jgi:hypothetical protein
MTNLRCIVLKTLMTITLKKIDFFNLKTIVELTKY